MKTLSPFYLEEIINDQQKAFTLKYQSFADGDYSAVHTNQNGRQKLIPFIVHH